MTCRLHSLLLLVVFASTARAEYISQSYLLDQSNTFGDGTTYGKVVVEAYNGLGAGGGGLSAGSVRLTFSADILGIYGTLGNFGIDRVAFNTDLVLKESQISGPTDWKITADKQVSGFGQFSWNVQKQKGPDRLNLVVVTIGDLGLDATIAHFLIDSSQKNGDVPPQGASPFAAHVAGFSGTAANNFTGSHFVGGGVPDDDDNQVSETPEPSALMLVATGIAALGFVAIRRRRVQTVSQPV